MSEHVRVNVADSRFLRHTLYQLVIAVRVARPAEVINDDKLSLICVISRGENRGKYPFLSLSKTHIRYLY